MDMTKLEEIRARYSGNSDGAPKGNNNAAGPHEGKEEDPAKVITSGHNGLDRNGLEILGEKDKERGVK